MSDTGSSALGRDELVALFARSVDSLWEPAARAVASWVWTRPHSDRWLLGPCWHIRHGSAPGRDLKRPPRRPTHVEEYGYDASGRLVISRKHYAELVERQIVEYHDGAALAHQFATTGEKAQLRRYAFDDAGRVALMESWAPDPFRSYMAERYVYDLAGRLSRVEFSGTNSESEENPAFAAVANGVQRLAYDAGELVSVVTTDGTGQTRVVYSTLDRPVEEAAKIALAGLTDAIDHAACSADTPAPACLLALRYTSGADPLLPPAVDLCTELDWEALSPSGDPGLLLNPAEWDNGNLEVEVDAGTRAACEEVGRWIAQHPETDLLRVLTLTLANMLDSRPWASRRAVSDDFLVYAVDIEIEDLARNLPPARSDRQAAIWPPLES